MTHSSRLYSFINAIVAIVLMTIVMACGDDTQFRVRGQVEGLGTRAINMIYVANGSVCQVSQPTIDGKFDLRGSSPDWTIVELYSRQNTLIGRALVKNGQTITCKMSLDTPYTIDVSGNTPSTEWSEWIRLNAGLLESGSHQAINDAVAQYVVAHRSSIASTALMLTQFYALDQESIADSLISIIEPQARPSSLIDSYRSLLAQNNNAFINERVGSFSLATGPTTTYSYVPALHSYSLLLFDNGYEHRIDTTLQAIKHHLDTINKRRLAKVEFSMASDSLSWIIGQTDSSTIQRVWAPGGFAHPSINKLNIPRLPYYIVADSNGVQIYRGGSIHVAIDTLHRRLNR